MLGSYSTLSVICIQVVFEGSRDGDRSHPVITAHCATCLMLFPEGADIYYQAL